MSITSGNIPQTAKPVLKFILSATSPKIQGPVEQPKSPERATIPNNKAPPDGKVFTAKESVPGQNILTVIPQKAQAARETTGFFEKPATR